MFWPAQIPQRAQAREQPRRGPAPLLSAQQLEGERQPVEGQEGVDLVETPTDRGEQLGEPSGPDHEWSGAVGPLLLDPAHYAVDRLGGAEHHACPDALLGSGADDA